MMGSKIRNSDEDSAGQSMVNQYQSNEPKDNGLVIDAQNVGLWLNGSEGPVEILNSIDLQVRNGEYVAVVGPSGSGKTMFLSAVAGLEKHTSGSLRVFGNKPVPEDPRLGFAMSRDALLPWRTARGNVELSLEALGVPANERRERAEQALAQVDLSDYADVYRAQLSQGMRQRVALARTLVTNPSLLLLDEPFAALDAQTRILMQERLMKLLGSYEGTVFLVTHDISEAILLCDRVIVFSHRPAHVAREIKIPLPRPRSAVHSRSTPEFQQLYEEIWAQLSREFSVEDI